MKIAVVIRRFDEAGTEGPARNAADLVRGLLRRGHEIHVLSTRFNASTREIRWHPVPGSLLHMDRPRRFAAAADRILAGHAFDIVHSMTRTWTYDVQFMGGGIHRVYMEHVGASGWNPRHWIANYVEKRSVLGSKGFLAVLAERTRKEILSTYPVDPGRIRLLRIGVDLDRFNPARRRERDEVRKELGLDPGTRVALLVGNNWKLKGVRYAIEAVNAAPGWTLLVCGKGSPFGLPPSGRVRFLGVRRDVERLHAAADALVHPSLYDPFPNACLEAMAGGLPVILTRVTGVAEIITDGVDGLILDHASDVEGLVRRLRLLEDRRRRAEIGAAARRRAEEFSVERYVDAYVGLYEEIVARKRAAAKS